MSTKLPFYRTEERQRALVAEALSWIGTPFRENHAVKGPSGGVSCERFQAALHESTGAAPHIELEPLPVEVVRHWHEHHSASRIIEWLGRPELRGLVARVDEGEQPMVGDIVVVKVDRTEHHIGVWCESVICHVAIPGGVEARSTRNPKLMELVRCYYRIMEVVS
jgi:hypothetical protein